MLALRSTGASFFRPSKVFESQSKCQKSKHKALRKKCTLIECNSLESLVQSADNGGLPAMVRFSRPHTVLGTTISVCSMTFLATSKIHFLHVLNLLGQAVVPAILMNVAIVGLNQVYDKKIDIVNKPYLPMASGEFSSNTGLLLISLSVAGAFIWATTTSQSVALMLTLLVSLLLGILYSVDTKLLRWKRFPLLAAGCILLVRALTVHIGFFMHASRSSLSAVFPSSLANVLVIMSLYSMVIAVFKDLPDTSGDSIYGIKTIGVRFGVKSSFWFCVGLLLFAQIWGVVTGIYCITPARSFVVVAGHILGILVLLANAWQVDKLSSASLHAYYMIIWKLFYAEYFLLPFIS
jgi:homogentisate phytyltransferase/homogentisate geranylgeranyltransferase